MQREYLIYLLYTFFFLALVAGFFVTPYLAFKEDMSQAYKIFGYTCHQKISRSQCLVQDPNSMWIADCTWQGAGFVESPDDRVQSRVSMDGATGYKIPVCARDVGLYLGMLIGALTYPLSRDIKETKMFNPIFLFLAIAPLALDGTVQLVSEMSFLPFVYESTNTIRLATGLLAGIAASYYAIPLLVGMFSPGGSKTLRLSMPKTSVPKTESEDSLMKRE